jgi:hypothetical protein
MLNANHVGNKTRLTGAITALSPTLPVLSSVAASFDPGAGNHTYVTLRHDGRVERVKVTGTTTGGLVVAERGADGTTAQTFPANTCVEVEWTPAMVCQFIATCNGANAPTPVSIVPQTVCMSSCSCLEVGSDGRITKIITAGTC